MLKHKRYCTSTMINKFNVFDPAVIVPNRGQSHLKVNVINPQDFENVLCSGAILSLSRPLKVIKPGSLLRLLVNS